MPVPFLLLILRFGQITRNYTHTVKWLLTTNKGCISGTGKMLDIRSFLLLGFPKGQAFGTRLCLQSVTKCNVLYVIRSVGVATKMGFPPGKARTFAAAGKRSYICGRRSRQCRSDCISRQGVCESPRFAPPCAHRGHLSRSALLVVMGSRGRTTTYELKMEMRKATFRLSRLDYPSAKPGVAVNGGCIYAPVYLER